MTLADVQPEGGYDYGDIPASDREELQTLARSVRYHVANAPPELVKAGEALTKAKARVQLHIKGAGWERWCKAEAGIHRSYAHKLMVIAREFGGSFPVETVRVLRHTAYEVANNAAASQAVKAMALNGEEVTETVARDLLATHAPKKAAPQPDTGNPLSGVAPEQGTTVPLAGIVRQPLRQTFGYRAFRRPRRRTLRAGNLPSLCGGCDRVN
jgi:hypothetical protein